MVHEAVVRYNGPGHQPKVSVLYFSDALSAADAQNFLNTLCGNLAAFLSNQYAITYEPQYRTINTVTGTLEAEANFPAAPPTFAGAIAAQPVPDAVSFLVRWQTGAIVSGRFLQGRMFVPGLAVSQLTGGNITPSVVAQMNTELAESFPGGVIDLVVWSRTHGVAYGVTSGTAWGELATQRRRRG